MFFRHTKMSLCAATFIAGMATSSHAERIDRGTQVIRGTTVHTTIYLERGYAVFENDCGRQQLSQGQLQAGATPDNIIPCPRPSASAPTPVPETRRSPPSTSTGRLWGATAAGIREGGLFGGGKVSVGAALNHPTESAARNAALASCEKHGVLCKVTGTFTGCGYATTSTDGSSPMVWTTGSDRQEVYQRCYNSIKSGNCHHPAIGGCNGN